MLGQYEAIFSETRPSFVHGLRSHLWHKIQHLRAHDFDDVALPGLQVRRVTQQEEKDIFLWLLWKLG